MALSKPILNQVVAFDKSDGYSFTFLAVGGNQVVKNRLTIQDNDNTIVYQEILSGFKFEHVLPSDNDLINGNLYNAYINTIDINDDLSPNSNIVPFYCYTTPTLTFENYPYNGIVNNSSYSVEAKFDQLEGELLDSVTINLYSSTNQLLQTSGKMYNSEDTPVSIYYEFTGLENNTGYVVSFEGATVNETYVASQNYDIFIEYITPTSFGLLSLENDCINGYVKYTTDFAIIDGTTEGGDPIYIDNDVIDLQEVGTYVKWNSGFRIDNNFALGMWFYPTNDVEFCEIKVDESNKFVLKLNKKDFLIEGTYEARSFIEVLGYQEGVLTSYTISNPVEVVNQKCKLLLRMKYINNIVTLDLNVLERVSSYIEWNGDSNVEFFKINDMEILNSDALGNVDSEFNNGLTLHTFQEVVLKNGIFDSIYITSDTTFNIPLTPIPKSDWNVATILLCNFDDNIRGGNVEFMLSQISKLRIKRRVKDTFEWIIISEFETLVLSDFVISGIDSFVPSNCELEYIIVPLLNDGTEGNYEIETIKTNFNGIFVSDMQSVFKLNSNIGLEGSQVKVEGVIQAIGNRTPYVVRNSNVNYLTEQVSGRLYGYNFEKTRQFDKSDILKQTNDFVTFLTNENTKVIKDWFGNICICEIVGNVSKNFMPTTGVVDVAFSYVEQGAYDVQSDLYSYGLVGNYLSGNNTTTI